MNKKWKWKSIMGWEKTAEANTQKSFPLFFPLFYFYLTFFFFVRECPHTRNSFNIDWNSIKVWVRCGGRVKQEKEKESGTLLFRVITGFRQSFGYWCGGIKLKACFVLYELICTTYIFFLFHIISFSSMLEKNWKKKSCDVDDCN